MWATIVAKYDKKGHMIQVDLHCRMMEKRIKETDDVRAHLDEMALMHEHLSSMGVTLHDEDYGSMVLRCNTAHILYICVSSPWLSPKVPAIYILWPF